MSDATLWLQVTSGRGPAECELGVLKAAHAFIAAAAEAGCCATLLDAEEGSVRGGAKSALLALAGDRGVVDRLLGAWEGTILWSCKSPLRPQHRRRNWYVGMAALRPPERSAMPLADRDLEVTTMRGSGPGGQHVNKTESAVRIRHLPSGIVVVAREERSQHANKRLALARLDAALKDRAAAAIAEAGEDRWRRHNELERGNPVRSFHGPDFRAG